MKKTQRSLKRWTEQEWGYSSPKEREKPRSKRGRYLPKKAWEALSVGEKRATNAAKRRGTRKGEQFVKQPSKIAKKTAKYRK